MTKIDFMIWSKLPITFFVSTIKRRCDVFAVFVPVGVPCTYTFDTNADSPFVAVISFALEAHCKFP